MMPPKSSATGADTLRAVLRGDDAALNPDALLAVRFARAVLQHDPEADVIRAEVQQRWGRRAVPLLEGCS